jgi:ABC-type transport system involved in multi-copper enzyme maturation permease subunit
VSPGGPFAPPAAGAAIAAIALNTCREAIRDRILYLLLAFALLVIWVSRLLSMLTVGAEEKIIKDVGLSAISLFGVLTTVFVGVSLVVKEIERRTVLTLLACPIARWQFVGGKFAGLVVVLGLNLGLMSATLLGIVSLRGEAPGSLVPALFLILVELLVIAAFALLFSSLTNPVLAALGTLAVYVAGHLSWSLELLADKVAGGVAGAICHGLYRLLPNFEYLDLKTEAVHALPIEPGRVVEAAAYGIGYATLVLALACFAFERKDFA